MPDSQKRVTAKIRQGCLLSLATQIPLSWLAPSHFRDLLPLCYNSTQPQLKSQFNAGKQCLHTVFLNPFCWSGVIVNCAPARVNLHYPSSTDASYSFKGNKRNKSYRMNLFNIHISISLDYTDRFKLVKRVNAPVPFLTQVRKSVAYFLIVTSNFHRQFISCSVYC